MKRILAYFLPVCILVALVAFVACEKVPDTERSQFNLMNPSDEARLGIAEFGKMKQQLRISTNPAYNAQSHNQINDMALRQQNRRA